MKKQIVLLNILVAALAIIPANSRAEDKPAAVEPATPAEHTKQGMPFHGKVTAVDPAAATLQVGKLTLNITTDTKIIKDDKPATLADVTVGEMVGGAYKKDGEKLKVTRLHIGLKPKGETGHKKADKTEKPE